jgi:DNA-binding beta-propeller fold protein YncE
VEGEHIKGSPFTVIVKLPVQKLGTPIKTINGEEGSCGVAVNKKGEIIVAERDRHCISIFSPTGEKLRSFGSQGSEPGQFKDPQGLTVDDDDNILVADTGNKRIQKFTPNGKFVALSTRSKCDFMYPVSVKVHPHSKLVYVSDFVTFHVYILNVDLTFNHWFGGCDADVGQFHETLDATFDSTGNVYVGGKESYNGIQVFTPEGLYLRKFGSHGSGDGQLDYPSAIAIDKQDIVYVTESNNNRVSIFKADGTFLTTFGTSGGKPGQFTHPHGIAVDNDGYIYVSDIGGRVQIF